MICWVSFLNPTYVTQGGGPVSGAKVYLFSSSGAYLGQSALTDAAGVARFALPDRAYRFRADYQGVQTWSGAVNIVPSTVTPVDILVTSP